MTLHTREVHIPGAKAPGVLVSPENARGAVIVVHEIFGRQPELVRVCERFAAHGFAALMPDLFGDRFKPRCIAQALGEIQRGAGEFIDVVVNAADVVAREANVDRAGVGVIGFCLGGGFALATGKVFKATSTNYGDMPPKDVIKGIGPTIGCYGSKDLVYRNTGKQLDQVLTELGVPHEIHRFDAGHAFLCDGDHPVAGALTRPFLNVNPARDVAARDEAWPKILAFFDAQLASTTAATTTTTNPGLM
jgi:carboxymethylenebutenolidase